MHQYPTIEEESPEKCDSIMYDNLGGLSYMNTNFRNSTHNLTSALLPHDHQPTPKKCSARFLQKFLLMVYCISSMIFGFVTYILDFGWQIETNSVGFFLLVSAFTFLWSFLLSFASTLAIVLGFSFCNSNKARSSFGCLPILYPVFLYLGLAGVIVLGGFLLYNNQIDNTLTFSYVIYQVSSGVLLYMISMYRLCGGGGFEISPHLQEMEPATFKLNESEIQKVREEVQEVLTPRVNSGRSSGKASAIRPRAKSQGTKIMNNLQFGSKKIGKKRQKNEVLVGIDMNSDGESSDEENDLEKDILKLSNASTNKDARQRFTSLTIDHKKKPKFAKAPLKLYRPKPK